MFTYRQDDYRWYVHIDLATVTNKERWNGKRPPPNYGQSGNVSMYTEEMYLPKPRIATHARYRAVSTYATVVVVVVVVVVAVVAVETSIKT